MNFNDDNLKWWNTDVKDVKTSSSIFLNLQKVRNIFKQKYVEMMIARSYDEILIDKSISWSISNL